MKKIILLTTILACLTASSVHADPKYASEVLARKSAYNEHLANPHTSEDANAAAAEISSILNSESDISSSVFDANMQKNISNYFSRSYETASSGKYTAEETDKAYHCLSAVKALVLSNVASKKLAERDCLNLYLTASELLDPDIIDDINTYTKAIELKTAFLNDIKNNDANAALAKLTEWAVYTADYYYSFLTSIKSTVFSDVAESDWFYKAVSFVCDKAIFKGTSDTMFEPHTSMTRAMFMTALSRMDNNSAAHTNPYTDVAPDAWYGNAVGWAYDSGCLSWINGSEFMPDNLITREEMVQTIYLYAKTKVPEPAEKKDISAFSDYAAVDADKTEAFAWAYSAGIVNGNSDGTLNPDGTAERCAVAQIFMNLFDALSKN